MDDEARQALVARYADGPRVVEEAVAGLTDEDLDRAAADGWTAREIVHHLADGEMTSAIRLRRLLVEDAPAIDSYDEERFAQVLRYRERPVAAALEALRASRATTVEIVRLLGPDEWERAGTHSASGRYSVEDWLGIYASHAHDHAEQIRGAVGRNG